MTTKIMTPQNITLYAAPFTSAMPAVTAILELGIDYEHVDLDLAAGEQRSPEHLARNPNGKVPTLVVDGVPMFEGLAIMQWLGDRFGVERDLWPAADAPERMTAMAWSTWAYVTLGNAVYRLNHAQSERSPAELHSEVHANAARRDIDSCLAILDAHLAKTGHVVGSAHSLADVIVGSTVLYARVCGASLDGHLHVQRWAEQLQGRAAFRKAWGQ